MFYIKEVILYTFYSIIIDKYKISNQFFLYTVNMESVGTTLAGCSTNRTCLTISMPQQSSWSKTATQAGNIWPFRVAPMVGCWWQLASIKGLIFTRQLLCKLGMSFYITYNMRFVYRQICRADGRSLAQDELTIYFV